MYPLPVTLVGCQDSIQRNVLSMLINQQANLEGQYPDLDTAVAALREKASNLRLFIIHIPDVHSLPKVRQLTSYFIGQPVLALVDPAADQSLLLGAMRSGAAQVVPLPIQPEDFRAAMECIAQQFGHAVVQNQVVAISGVTGGCGATTIAVNLSYEIAAQHNQSVILSE